MGVFCPKYVLHILVNHIVVVGGFATKIGWMADLVPKHRLEGTCFRYQRKRQNCARHNGVENASSIVAGRFL